MIFISDENLRIGVFFDLLVYTTRLEIS